MILTGALKSEVLKGQFAIVSGEGDGITFDAARSLLLLGAKVIIAGWFRFSDSDRKSFPLQEDRFGLITREGRLKSRWSEIPDSGQAEEMKP